MTGDVAVAVDCMIIAILSQKKSANSLTDSLVVDDCCDAFSSYLTARDRLRASLRYLSTVSHQYDAGSGHARQSSLLECVDDHIDAPVFSSHASSLYTRHQTSMLSTCYVLVVAFVVAHAYRPASVES